MAEDVGHVDGDLDLVVECLGPGVGVTESDGPEDVVLASVGLPAWFDDLGDAAVGGLEDPSFQPGPGLVDGPSPFAAPVVVLRALASAARTPGCRLRAPHPDHRRGSGTQRGIVRRHVLNNHAFLNRLFGQGVFFGCVSWSKNKPTGWLARITAPNGLKSVRIRVREPQNNSLYPHFQREPL